MSRFVEILHHEREISVDSFRAMLGEMTDAARCRRRPYRDELPVLRHEARAGVRGREPDGLPGVADRRDPRRRAPASGSRSWCRSPACARARRRSPITARTTSARTSPSRRGCAQHMWIEELIEHRRERGLVRALRHPQAPRREVRHRARLRQSEVRRGHGARRRRAAQRRASASRAYVVESENFESIHNHSAYALIEHDKDQATADAGARRRGIEGSRSMDNTDLAHPQRQSRPERPDLLRACRARRRRASA